MTKRRVQIQFDIEISDEETARSYSRDFLRTNLKEWGATDENTDVEGGGSIEGVTYEIVEGNDLVVTSLVAVAVLYMGAQSFPWVEVTAPEATIIDDDA